MTFANKPKCFEHLLAREFSIAACPLYEKIVTLGSLPISETRNEIMFSALVSFPDPKQPFESIMTANDKQSQLVGEHKVDVFVPLKSGRIYVQATTINEEGPNHDKQLNFKARGFFKAAAPLLQKSQLTEPHYLVFASLYDFEVSKLTAAECTKLTAGNVHCLIIKGSDFDHTQYPFHILREENPFENPDVVLALSASIGNLGGVWQKELLSPALKKRKIH